MEKLRTPILIQAIYLILLGLSTLNPSLTLIVFGYEVKDAGVLFVLSSMFFSLGAVVWAIASNPVKHADLAWALAVALIIGAVFLIRGWTSGLYTARQALAPIIIDVVLAGWIWWAKPKS